MSKQYDENFEKEARRTLAEGPKNKNYQAAVNYYKNDNPKTNNGQSHLLNSKNNAKAYNQWVAEQRAKVQPGVKNEYNPEDNPWIQAMTGDSSELHRLAGIPDYSENPAVPKTTIEQPETIGEAISGMADPETVTEVLNNTTQAQHRRPGSGAGLLHKMQEAGSVPTTWAGVWDNVKANWNNFFNSSGDDYATRSFEEKMKADLAGGGKSIDQLIADEMRNNGYTGYYNYLVSQKDNPIYRPGDYYYQGRTGGYMSDQNQEKARQAALTAAYEENSSPSAPVENRLAANMASLVDQGLRSRADFKTATGIEYDDYIASILGETKGTTEPAAPEAPQFTGTKATNVPDTGDNQGVLGRLAGAVANAGSIPTVEDDQQALYDMYLEKGPQSQPRSHDASGLVPLPGVPGGGGLTTWEDSPPATPKLPRQGEEPQPGRPGGNYQREATEDIFMGDTYPEMQIGSGYNGPTLPLDQQRFMYTDPIRSATPGLEGGVYRNADGSYTNSGVEELEQAERDQAEAALIREYNNQKAAGPQVNPEFERRIADAERFGISLNILASQVQNQPEFYNYILAKLESQNRNNNNSGWANR